MRLNRVDFPAAFGPMTAMISPAFMIGVVTPDTVSFCHKARQHHELQRYHDRLTLERIREMKKGTPTKAVMMQ